MGGVSRGPGNEASYVHVHTVPIYVWLMWLLCALLLYGRTVVVLACIRRYQVHVSTVTQQVYHYSSIK